MSDREIKFVGGGWVVSNDASHRLRQKGYSADGYIDKGVRKYALYRDKGGRNFELIHEFNTPEELNNMVKLLLDE